MPQYEGPRVAYPEQIMRRAIRRTVIISAHAVGRASRGW